MIGRPNHEKRRPPRWSTLGLCLGLLPLFAACDTEFIPPDSGDCGDGIIGGPEECDDGSTLAGDGCSATCQVEPGWSCTGEPSVCHGICGDGIIVDTEECDDGSTLAGDGCAADCTIEAGWSCDGEPSVCDPICGDGHIVGGEACDDGGTSSGDGCSAACQVEPGWLCTGEPSTCTLEVTDWHDPLWGFRKRITIHASQVEADLTDFPVLIALSADADLAAAALPDGDDLVFTAADETTQLSHEIQRFNGSTGELIAWVKVPLLSGSADTVLFLYYGNAGASNQESVADVWSNGYEAVLHLQEAGSGQADEYTDSSGNGHHGTGGGQSGDLQATPSQTTGLFGNSQEFVDDASADLIRIRSTSDGAWTAITVQAWISPDDHGDDRIFAKTWGTIENRQVWQLGKETANKVRIRTNVTFATVQGGTDLVLGDWTLLAMTWEAGFPGNIDVYQNGLLDVSGTIDGTDLNDRNDWPTIGNVPDGSRGFDGLIQEVRLSRVARSQAWLRTEYLNQRSPQTFHTVGPAVAQP